MICLRCGYCCIECSVVIVNPSKIKDDSVFEISNDCLQFKDSKEPCPHLEWDGDGFTCKIHHYEWYKSTPCFSHGQFETKNSDCRMGRYIIDNYGIDHYIKKIKNGELKNEKDMYTSS